MQELAAKAACFGLGNNGHGCSVVGSAANFEFGLGKHFELRGGKPDQNNAQQPSHGRTDAELKFKKGAEEYFQRNNKGGVVWSASG